MAEQESYRPPHPGGLINIATIAPGQRVRLRNGGTAEVVTNARDGMWLQVRFLAEDGSPEDGVEMVFADEVAAVLD